MIVSWRFGPKAEANPWRANSIEWQVSSPPPIFNFDEIPRVVGGPYEFGVPGARHAIMAGEGAEVPATEPSVVGSDMSAEGRERPLLVFLNEVAGGRKLLQAVRERQDKVSERRRRRAAEPALGRPADRRRRAARRRPRPGRGDDVGARRVRDRLGRRGDGPGARAGARRRGPRPRARRGAALLPLRHPFRHHPQGPGRVGPRARRTGGEADPHPGADRRRRDPLGPDPHARRRDQDRRAPDLVNRLKERAAGQPAPLHDHLPAHRGRQRGRDRPRPRLDAGRALPRRRRRDRPADEPRSLPGGPERDRALPDRRGADLDLRRRESRWLEGDLIGRVREITDKQVSTSRSAARPRPSPPPWPREGRTDGERDRRPRARSRRARAPRSAGGEPKLADRQTDARDPALHRLRGHALRRVLRLVLLPPRSRRPAELNY